MSKQNFNLFEHFSVNISHALQANINMIEVGSKVVQCTDYIDLKAP